MIKEYINQLYMENQAELEKLEKQMKNLLDDINYCEQWAESLQRENSEQKNIFSPRNMNFDLNKKIETNQNRISNLKQQMEYTRELVEAHVKKKTELQTLLLEVEDEEERGKLNSSQFSIENMAFNVSEVKNLLNEIYKKTEFCIAMLSSNKNVCKTELQGIKRMIREYADKVK